MSIRDMFDLSTDALMEAAAIAAVTYAGISVMISNITAKEINDIVDDTITVALSAPLQAMFNNTSLGKYVTMSGALVSWTRFGNKIADAIITPNDDIPSDERKRLVTIFVAGVMAFGRIINVSEAVKTIKGGINRG